MSDDFAHQCAAQVMDTIHLIMRNTGPEMRKRTPSGISVQQFRSMLAIHLHKCCSLSDVAEHLGSTISSTSKMVDGLVERGLVSRETDSADRRKMVLTLTQAGEGTMETVRLAGLDALSGRLSSLTPGECAMIELVMKLLRSALVQTPGSESQR